MAYAVTPPQTTSAPTLGEIVELDDGATVTIRAIELADIYRVRRMFDRLSPETVYHRFFAPVPPPRAETLIHLASVDHDHREALVAVHDGEVVGVAQYDSRTPDDDAEVAVAVEDAWQDHGLGTALLVRLARVGARRGLRAFTAIVMGENSAAVRFLKRLSPETTVRLDGGEYVVYAPLCRPGRSATR
jgi:RimJ/RimL family protein N-acetyltransferase